MKLTEAQRRFLRAAIASKHEDALCRMEGVAGRWNWFTIGAKIGAEDGDALAALGFFERTHSRADTRYLVCYRVTDAGRAAVEGANAK